MTTNIPENVKFQDLALNRAVIEFTQDWDKDQIFEGFAQPGMRARIFLVKPEHEGCVSVHVDYSEFEDHNRAFEAHDYNGKDGNLTDARSAGFYKAQEEFWFSETDKPTGFRLLHTDNLGLMAAWKADATGLTYTAWLERELLAMKTEKRAAALSELAAQDAEYL